MYTCFSLSLNGQERGQKATFLQKNYVFLFFLPPIARSEAKSCHFSKSFFKSTFCPDYKYSLIQSPFLFGYDHIQLYFSVFLIQKINLSPNSQEKGQKTTFLKKNIVFFLPILFSDTEVCNPALLGFTCIQLFCSANLRLKFTSHL